MSKINFKQIESDRIPEGWQEQVLYDLAEWKNGLAFRDINFCDSGRPVIKINELKYGITKQTQFTEQAFNEEYFLKKGNLLFSWSGSPETSIDVFWYSLPDGWLNQHIFKITVKSEVDEVFFYYLLKFLKPFFIRIAGNKQTTGLGHVTIRDLKDIKVRIPGLAEQKAVIKPLYLIDQKIDLNQRMNETLEAMTRALFVRWFVDENGLGSCRVADLVEFDPFISVRKGNVLPYVDMKALSERAMSISNVVMKPFAGGAKFQNNDTLLARITPCLENGKTGFVDFLGDRTEVATGSTEFIVMRPKNGAPPQFVYCLARDPQFRECAIQSMVGSSGRQRVQVDALAEYEVLRPGKEDLVKFELAADTFFQQVRKNRNEIILLSQIRDSLLPRLMSGEISI